MRGLYVGREQQPEHAGHVRRNNSPCLGVEPCLNHATTQTSTLTLPVPKLPRSGRPAPRPCGSAWQYHSTATSRVSLSRGLSRAEGARSRRRKGEGAPEACAGAGEWGGDRQNVLVD